MSLIDGDALKAKILKSIGIADELAENYEGRKSIAHAFIDSALSFVIECIDAAPTIDAEPVVHARWIEVSNGRGGHCCSECREYAPSFQSGVEDLSARCHCCGAKMDGKEGSNAKRDE